jgi:exonuclease SbcD
VLTDPVRPVDGMRRLQERFPFAVRMEWQPEDSRSGEVLRYGERVRGRDDVELAGCFLADCRGGEPTEADSRLLHEAFTAVRAAEVSR